MGMSETTGTQQSVTAHVSDPRMKIQDMPSSNEQRTLEHHRALTDYTATLTEAVEVAKIPIVDRSKDVKPKPILRPTPDLDPVAFTNKDAPSDFQTVKHGSAPDSLIPFRDQEITMKQKRVKSATRNKRRFQATQPYTTKSSLGGHRAGRPLSGVGLLQDVEDQSTFLVNNLIVNNTAGGVSRQYARNQTYSAATGKNSDIMRLPTVSSNRNASRCGGPNTQGQPSGGQVRPGEEITINQVTPELAAQVVKHFVLPMFDTEAKKGLRRKYGRMQAATQYGTLQPHTAGQVQPTQGAPD